MEFCPCKSFNIWVVSLDSLDMFNHEVTVCSKQENYMMALYQTFFLTSQHNLANNNCTTSSCAMADVCSAAGGRIQKERFRPA